MQTEISRAGKKWRTEGWISLTLRDFGLGVHLYRWRSRKQGGTRGLTITIYFLFLDFHLEIWKRM